MTLSFEPALQARLDALRERHFPPERNFIPAHLTLFHALPGRERQSVESALAMESAGRDRMTATSSGLLDFGGGVAIAFDVDGLPSLHEKLRQTWSGWLTRQDDRKLRPHVTVQNKVERETAKATLAELRGTLPTLSGAATGLDLWYYRGGPWEFIRHFPFRTETA